MRFSLEFIDPAIKSALIRQTVYSFLRSDDHNKFHVLGVLFDALSCLMISKLLSRMLFTREIIQIDYYNDPESCTRSGVISSLNLLIAPFLCLLLLLTVPRSNIHFAFTKSMISLEAHCLFLKWVSPLIFGFIVAISTLFLIKMFFVVCKNSINKKLTETELLIRELECLICKLIYA